MKILVVIILLITPVFAQEQEFTVDQYEFIWKAYSVQHVEIYVTKNEISTRLSLSDEGLITMSAQEAVQLAEDLELAIELKAAEDTIEATSSKLVERSPFLIWHTPDSTFSVVRTDIGHGQIGLNAVQAKAIIPYLEKAPRMISFVDNLIHF